MNFNFQKKFKKLKLKMKIDDNYKVDYKKLEQTKKSFFKNKKELSIGKMIPIDDLFIIDDVFTYEGIPVVIYIKDHSFGSVLNIKDRRKVHLLNCNVIKEMKEKDRFGRYVSTSRTDGLYKISKGKKEMEKELDLCKVCIKKIATLTDEKVESAKDFLESDFITKEFDEKDIKYDEGASVYYPPNWDKISEQLRKNANYTCQKCKKDMSKNKKDLHVHHKNGVKQDVNPKNLEVLCYDCHSDEPGHSHMKKNKFGTR